jgi:hypothetical protein
MNRLFFLIITLHLSFVVWSAELETPEKAMSVYCDAMRSYDTSAMANLMHPDALSRFRAVFDSAFNGARKVEARKQLLPLFSVNSYEEFSKLGNADAFQMLNKNIASMSPELVSIMKESSCEIIGSIPKGDEVLITYTLGMTIKGQKVSKDVVQRLKKLNNKWLLMLPPTAEETIAGIEAEF